MEPYKEMYLKLFNAVTDSIESLRGNNAALALYTLIRGQRDTEELFLSSESVWLREGTVPPLSA